MSGGTCIPLPVRLPTPGSLMDLALQRLLIALVAGTGTLGVSFLVAWTGLLAWVGSVTVKSPSVPLVMLPLVLCVVLARIAARAMAADVIIDESLKWSRRTLEAVGVLMDEPPTDCRHVRPWMPGWSPLLIVPCGWVVILALNACDLVPLVRAWWASHRTRRATAWLKADESLDAYASALDGVTLRSPTGTFFGCLVHPVPHAVRTRLILDRFLAGVVWASVPGCVWAGVVLASVPFGLLWGSVAGVHVVGIAVLWATGILRLRLVVALVWQHQQRSIRHTIRDATSDRDVVMRLVENSTWEAP